MLFLSFPQSLVSDSIYPALCKIWIQQGFGADRTDRQCFAVIRNISRKYFLSLECDHVAYTLEIKAVLSATALVREGCGVKAESSV